MSQETPLVGDETHPKWREDEPDSDDEEHGCFCFKKEKNEDDHDVGKVPHHCTDLICLLLFIATMVGYGMILIYAKENGDPRRLYHGYDFLGELCGLDQNSNKSVLFYCKNDEGMLDMQHPICRESCPNTDDPAHQYSCYWKMETRQADFDYPNLSFPNLDITYSDESFNVESIYMFRERQDYPSMAIMGTYCMPTNRSSPMFAELQGYLETQPMYRVLTEVTSVLNAWSVLVVASILSIIFGFAYLFLLEHCACCLVYSALSVLIGSLMLFGGYSMYVFFNDADGIDDIPGTGDRTLDCVIGVCCLILGTFFLVITMCCNEAIQVAVGVIEATSECMMTMRSLFIEPLLTGVYKACVFSCLMAGFLLLLSCGDMTSVSIEQFAAVTAPGAPSGILRSFTYSDSEWKLIIAYIFIIYWILELANATSQFVLAYVVQSWYFSPYNKDTKEKVDIPSCTLFSGYCVAFMYHMGSLAYGSFIIALSRLVRLVLAQIAKQAKGENQALACIAACLGCCVYCFQKCMEFINKNAYMDIAVNSNNFCTAAYNAFWFIVKSMPEIATLNGACWIFMVAGVGGITGGCSYVVFMSVGYFDVYSNPTSEWYVQDKVMVTVFGGGIAFVISMGFMSVFDMVADTILFCFVVEKNRRNPKHKNPLSPSVQYAPDILHVLAAGAKNNSDSQSEESDGM